MAIRKSDDYIVHINCYDLYLPYFLNIAPLVDSSHYGALSYLSFHQNTCLHLSLYSHMTYN
jgi:hypothetical protein